MVDLNFIWQCVLQYWTKCNIVKKIWMVGVGRILNHISITCLQKVLLIELIRTLNTHSILFYIYFFIFLSFFFSFLKSSSLFTYKKAFFITILMELKCDKLIMVAITSISIRRVKTLKNVIQHSKQQKNMLCPRCKPKKITSQLN